MKAGCLDNGGCSLIREAVQLFEGQDESGIQRVSPTGPRKDPSALPGELNLWDRLEGSS